MHCFELTNDQVVSLQRGELTRLVVPVHKSEHMPKSVIRSKIDAAYRAEVWRYGNKLFYAGKWLTAVCAGRSVGECQIRAIRKRRLKEMNSHDAQQCGFYTIVEFQLDWDRRYKYKPFQWAGNPDVWVIEIVYHTKVFTTAPLSPDVLESSLE